MLRLSDLDFGAHHDSPAPNDDDVECGEDGAAKRRRLRDPVRAMEIRQELVSAHRASHRKADKDRARRQQVDEAIAQSEKDKRQAQLRSARKARLEMTQQEAELARLKEKQAALAAQHAAEREAARIREERLQAKIASQTERERAKVARLVAAREAEREAADRAAAMQAERLRRLRTMRAAFSAWRSLAEATTLASVRVTTQAQWRLQVKTWQAWRSAVRARVLTRERAVVAEALRRQRVLEARADDLRHSQLLSRAVLGWQGVARRQAAARRARESHARRRALMEAALDDVEATIDRDGGATAATITEISSPAADHRPMKTPVRKTAPATTAAVVPATLPEPIGFPSMERREEERRRRREELRQRYHEREAAAEAEAAAAREEKRRAAVRFFFFFFFFFFVATSLSIFST